METYSELTHYMHEKEGLISRTALNITACIGVFIFGWLITVVFDGLGKKGLGWIYLILLGVFVAGSVQMNPAFGPVAALIYIGAWIHANLILSRYHSLARSRIQEIDRLNPPELDSQVEKGLLCFRILKDKQHAADVLVNALTLPSGTPTALRTAGDILTACQQTEQAAEFYERAIGPAVLSKFV